MQILINIIENIAITLMIVAALAGFAWLMLLALHWGLRFKSGSREQDGLVDLWQEAMTKKAPKDEDTKREQPNR